MDKTLEYALIKDFNFLLSYATALEDGYVSYLTRCREEALNTLERIRFNLPVKPSNVQKGETHPWAFELYVEVYDAVAGFITSTRLDGTVKILGGASGKDIDPTCLRKWVSQACRYAKLYGYSTSEIL